MKSEKKLLASLGKNIKTHQVQLRNHTINYVKLGSGEPLLLIHGLNIGWGQWKDNIKYLSRYFTVYALDLPSSGGSTKIDFHTADLEESFVGVVHDFIKKLKLKNLHVIGHSTGGWVSLKLALKDNKLLKKMILVNPLGLTEHVPIHQRLLAFYPFAKLISQTAMYPSKKNLKAFLTSVVQKPQVITDDLVDYFQEAVTREKVTHPFSLIHRIVGFRKVKKPFVLTQHLPKLKIPILIINGEKDIIVRAKDIRNAVKQHKNIKVHILKNIGHVPSIEASKVFNEVSAKFLK